MDEIRIDKFLRSRRRTVGIEITREAKLVVRAPRNVSQEEDRKSVVEGKR